MIFHPPTGLCVLRKSLTEPLQLGSCAESEPWKYSPQQILFLKGTYFCMQADGLGKPAKLGIMCTDPGSNWDVISDGNMHLSSNLVDGTAVCLDVDSNNNIVTNSCKYSSEDHTPDSASQWFEIVRNSKTQLPLPVRNSPLNPLHPEEQIQSERDVRHGEEGLSNQ
nr:TPA_asm: hypothetical protein HUJ06_016630 [Nelumbo nucifera]